MVLSDDNSICSDIGKLTICNEVSSLMNNDWVNVLQPMGLYLLVNEKHILILELPDLATCASYQVFCGLKLYVF